MENRAGWSTEHVLVLRSERPGEATGLHLLLLNSEEEKHDFPVHLNPFQKPN